MFPGGKKVLSQWRETSSLFAEFVCETLLFHVVRNLNFDSTYFDHFENKIGLLCISTTFMYFYLDCHRETLRRIYTSKETPRLWCMFNELNTLYLSVQFPRSIVWDFFSYVGWLTFFYTYHDAKCFLNLNDNKKSCTFFLSSMWSTLTNINTHI